MDSTPTIDLAGDLPADRNGEVIRNPIQIAYFLRRVAEHRGLVEVRVSGAPGPLHTAILAADRETGVILDEMLPREVAAHIALGSEVAVHGQHEGGPFRFSSALCERGSEHDIPFFRLVAPASLRHRQRRSFHRAVVPWDTALGARIEPDVEEGEESIALDARLQDISVGGCRLRVESDDPQQSFDCGRCVLWVPDEELVSCRFQPCHIEQTAPGHWAVGGRYLDLGRPDLRKLERIIASLEREMARLRLR